MTVKLLDYLEDAGLVRLPAPKFLLSLFSLDTLGTGAHPRVGSSDPAFSVTLA